MTEHFGQTIPGANMGPDDDFDGDGQTNMQEFLGETDPTDPTDNFSATVVFTKGNAGSAEWSLYEFGLVELSSSTDLKTFTPVTLMQVVNNETEAGLDFQSDSNEPTFYRLRRID
ncbi:hypothetical protein [Cerasicoccus fimbriatus]|uniref:hypothetical protein n=1 Tax=Cerasicoccus fimbriatus TaxID=3014554 RepID=UPI0022B44FEA|nr:hypothetical protein [Cerasicoccus sp. TK19100]